MATTYHPRKPYFSPNRIQLVGKEIIRDCAEDRVRALEAFDYYKGMVDANPEDDKSKSEMIKALELSMEANNRKIKMLDTMVKLAIHRDKTQPAKATEKELDKLSFEDFNQVKK
jgi:hypothetical protein